MRAFACVLALSVLLAGTATAAPRRVASLNLCTDELLLSLADPGQVASVTYLAQQPEESTLWRQARAYPKNDGSLISIVRYRPDLVITMGGGGRDSARIAQRLGIQVLNLPYPQNLGDMEAMVLQVARVLGREAGGRGIVERTEQLRRNRPARSIDTIWLAGGGLTLAANGLGADWMALAGLRQRSVRGDRVTLEQLVAAPPAILLRSAYRSGEYSADQHWLAHPLMQRARAGRTIRTDGRPWTCLGPPMIDEILRLRAAAM
jgi:iron complex transport system substrate-binding protein